MRELLKSWRNQEEYLSILAGMREQKITVLSGLSALPKAALAAALFEDNSGPLLILTAEESEAMVLAEDLRPFLGDRVLHFPVLELLPFEVYAHNIELISARVSALSRLVSGEKLLVVACVNAVTRRLTPPAVFAGQHLRLHMGGRHDLSQLAAQFADMGYERTALTEIPGTFSLRGSIIDIFPIVGERPYRLEFFDDEIESIRYFDPAQQLSQEKIEGIFLPPARELPVDAAARRRAALKLDAELTDALRKLRGENKRRAEQTFQPLLEFLDQGLWDNALEMLTGYFYADAGSIFDYLPGGMTLLSEPQYIRQTSLDQKDERNSRYFDLLESGRILPSFYDNFLDYEELRDCFLHQRLLLLCQLSMQTGDIVPQIELNLASHELPAYAHDPEGFARDMRDYLRRGYRVTISASSELRLQRAREIVSELGLAGANVMQAGWSSGFVSPALKTALVTEKELFAKEGRKKHRRTYKGGERIDNFLDLRSGDYVVHIYQGIGQYMGVERLTIGEIERDYLLIRYGGEDRLYLPVDQLDLIQKYIGGEGNAPKLNRLGGAEWTRTKAKVRAAVQEMAGELLQLYAAREQVKGFSFSPDVPWQREFEDAFPYVETEDQLVSAAEIKRDMESDQVMDRLLCGDVGYGKTEIALRAAFKAIMDMKQVAILVPTTVLAQQHYRTIEQRFEGFPIRYATLSRFSSVAGQKQTLRELARGDIDLVVGTHRLLSADVRFKDLGLLIIDEEQRFGVKHKEKIKALKTQVDVLTLSATPIPRTLHMALVGMRDMSIISTPPEDRHPVQTYVVEYHERLIRDAIAREMGRGGQVFFLHNRVFDIYDVAEELQRILPEARVEVAHGQMKERELEQAMLDFVAGGADVLVCTTIIESGLDIPNANTLIVDDADTFGLAQLYQLRGRVGRSERQAFAYFTFKRERLINDIAKKRLITIRDFTELGSGFKIAMRDLELRGAGNLLGPEQHGHIMAVGFDLYCKLLEEETQRVAGQAAPKQIISTQLELEINAYIPDSFVTDSVLKIEIYKRIAAAISEQEVDELAEELRDRYGELPPTVYNLCLLGKVKVLGKKLAIASVMQKAGHIEIKLADEHPVSGEALLALLDKWPKRLAFSNKKGFMIKLDTNHISKDLARIDILLRVLNDLSQLIAVETKPM